MTQRRKMWVYSPPKPPKPKVPDSLNARVTSRAAGLVNTYLKPTHMKYPQKNIRWNYIVDIYTKWQHNCFYFCAKYASPAPNALSPFFEIRFARMEYKEGGGRFNLSYMRHTDKWLEIYRNLSLDQCLEFIKDGGLFLP
jgi:hypothetical protein